MGADGGKWCLRNETDSRRSPARTEPEARERLARKLERAFPLPDTGAFKDLLGALTND